VSIQAAAISPPSVIAAASARPPDGVKLLQIFAVTVLVFPSDAVLRPIGAAGYIAGMFGVFILAIYGLSVVLGVHEPRRHRHPMRGMLAIVWLSLLASYLLMDRGQLDSLQTAGADRNLIKYAVITGVVLVGAEWLRSLDDIMRVLRVLCWAGAFCAFVALLQFFISLDLSQYLRSLPGFVVNHDSPAIQLRGSLNRVQGTATTPIELGVVMGMLVPIAVCVAHYDRDKPVLKRWTPLGLIILGVATSISRSGVLAIVVSLVVLVVLMPPRQRVAALAALPIGVAGVFMTAHGLIGTLTTFFTGASSDSSVLYRTHDYPVAEGVWRTAAWFGHGPGSWMPADPLNIFDNQYLDAAVELGSIGVVVLLIFLIYPGVVVLVARRSSTNPDFRLMCAALGGAALVSPVCSATFDSMAFLMYVNFYALVIGLIGACWRLAAAEREGRALSPAASARPLGVIPQTVALRPRRVEP
jgi:O-antigen ligase